MIPDAWFIFNGVDSRDMGIIVTKMPETIRAEHNIDGLEIAGRNGKLHVDHNTYKSYDKTMECAIRKRSRIDDIAAWLDGNGEIIFSTEPDKIYDVCIANKIPISAMMRFFQKFQVILDTQPLKRSTNSDSDRLLITAPTTIRNCGTVQSRPEMTIYGNGNITITINDIPYVVHNLDGYITINSETEETYKGNLLQNNKCFFDDFPVFRVGENYVNFDGNISKIDIRPNWRWL